MHSFLWLYVSSAWQQNTKLSNKCTKDVLSKKFRWGNWKCSLKSYSYQSFFWCIYIYLIVKLFNSIIKIQRNINVKTIEKVFSNNPYTKKTKDVGFGYNLNWTIAKFSQIVYPNVFDTMFVLNEVNKKIRPPSLLLQLLMLLFSINHICWNEI